MAEDALDEDDDLEEKEPKNILKILVFVLAALLLVGVTVAATLYLTGFFDVKDVFTASISCRGKKNIILLKMEVSYLPLLIGSNLLYLLVSNNTCI